MEVLDRSAVGVHLTNLSPNTTYSIEVETTGKRVYQRLGKLEVMTLPGTIFFSKFEGA